MNERPDHDSSGLKPTKPRRERRPETIAFLQRALRGALLDVEIPARLQALPKRGYKLFATALIARLDWLYWRGQDQRGNDAAVLSRVAMLLLAGRWEVSEDERRKLDRLRKQITALLVAHPALWHVAQQRYLVHKDVRTFVRRLEQHPRLDRLVAAARQQLADEFNAARIPGWHLGGVGQRATQLRKEIGDVGTLPDRLRDLTRNMRARGDVAGRDQAALRPSATWTSWADLCSSTELHQ